MALDLHSLSADTIAFLTDRHLATLTTLRLDGSPHVVPVGFSYEPVTRIVRIICSAGSQKTRNIAHNNRAVVAQVDGGRWLSLEGTAVVSDDPARVAEAERRYSARYQEPRVNPNRVAIEITIDRILGRG